MGFRLPIAVQLHFPGSVLLVNKDWRFVICVIGYGSLWFFFLFFYMIILLLWALVFRKLSIFGNGGKKLVYIYIILFFWWGRGVIEIWFIYLMVCNGNKFSDSFYKKISYTRNSGKNILVHNCVKNGTVIRKLSNM